MKELHVVFGTGPLALAVMRALRKRGKRVRMVNRTGWAGFEKDLDTEVGGIDAADPAQAREVCQGAACVYHCIGLPYAEWDRLPAIAAGILDGAASAGAPLIYGDNLYMYGPVAGLMHEDLPAAAGTRKGRIRAQVADCLLEAHRAGRIRAAIGRASDFFGPHATDNAMMGSRVFGAALARRTARVIGNPDALHSYTYLEDFAGALVAMGERVEALGSVWHVPTAPAVTTREFVHKVYRAAGARPKLMAAGRRLLSVAALLDSQLKELGEMLYQFERDFVLDSTRFEKTFGIAPTPLDDSIRATLDWFRGKAVRARL
ncbi:MAG TPA: NAD-dependent epimerase/dehydratase family protein [Burkholderiales bacterium]|nr:NAD-dependent epimerase/dehydratase family protein [Burkholderiales bacterium]